MFENEQRMFGKISIKKDEETFCFVYSEMMNVSLIKKNVLEGEAPFFHEKKERCSREVGWNLIVHYLLFFS